MAIAELVFQYFLEEIIKKSMLKFLKNIYDETINHIIFFRFFIDRL